jgi:hypothetical protein
MIVAELGSRYSFIRGDLRFAGARQILDEARPKALYYDPEFDRHLPFLYHKPKNTRILH